MPSNIITRVTIAIVLAMLYAAFTNKLSLYIHPRYIVFTTVLISIGIVFLLINDFNQKPHHYLQQLKNKPMLLLLIIFVASVLLLPPTSLSQLLASSRSSEAKQNNLASTERSTVDNFSSDLTRFTIADWNNLLASQPSADQIVGKKALVEGFIYTDGSDQLFVARFRLTCCAVDATPLAIPLIETPDIANLSPGAWIRLTGEFNEIDNSSHPYQINPSEVTEIEEPDAPYIF